MNRHERRARQVQQRRRFPHIGIGATAVYVDPATGTHPMKVIAHCNVCGCAAVVELPPPLLAKVRAEDDSETTHVCLPQIGGCNTGFTYEAPPPVGEKPRESEGPPSST